jgi:hypothetical protein
MKRNFFIILALSTLLFSCEKNSQPFTDTPIIEAYLSEGAHPVVKIYRQIPFSSDVTYSSDVINALSVNLGFSGSSVSLLPLGDSLYSDTTVSISEGIKYTLSFSFNLKTVSAYTTVPSKPEEFTQSATTISVARMDSTFTPGAGGFTMPDPVVLKWKNTDTSYYIVVIENMETVLDPIRDWGTSTRPGSMFRERPTTASGLELRPQEFQYFGKHRIILFHIQPDYASLYDNNGVSSSQNLTNPSTSIVNGYGIFTGLNSDTLYIQVNESSK